MAKVRPPISAPPIDQGTRFRLSTAPAPEPGLPERAGVLPERLQEIARLYIGARQKTGESLLESARWLSEARQEAKHGEWKTFLEATGTSDDAAERLLNIHSQAMQNPQFADSVRTQWIGQSAAALLALPSTPPQIIEQVLNAPEPMKVEAIRSAIKEAKQPAPALHPDYQQMAAVERILKEAAGHGERTGTAMYQEAYGHARQIRDVTLYNRAFAMIDRAVGGEPPAQEQPKISAAAEAWKAELLTPAPAEQKPKLSEVAHDPAEGRCGIRNCPRDVVGTHQIDNQGAFLWFCDQHAPIIAALNSHPRKPVSEDSSAHFAYMQKLETQYARLEIAVKALLKLI